MKNTIYFKFLVLFAVGFLGLQVNAQTQAIKDSASVTSGIEAMEVFTFADEMPDFPGGKAKMYEYLSANIKYPIAAKTKKVEGKVVLTFIVIPSGEIIEVKQIGIRLGDGLDEEAIRVVRAMPNWTPGKMDGKPVAVKYTLPIRFALN